MKIEGPGAATSLTRLMTEMYRQAHPPDGRKAQKEKRQLEIGGPVDLEIFLSGMRRQQYEQRNRLAEQRRQAGERLDCRLCFPKTSLVYRDRIAIAPDGIPFFPDHMLLRPVVQGALGDSFETIGPQLRRGKVLRGHLACRPDFTYEDIVAMCQLVSAEQQFMVNQAMAGSGASVPEHIHAHAFRENKDTPGFPLLDQRCFAALKNAAGKAWVNTRVTYGLAVCGQPELIAEVLVGLREAFGLPSNHYLRIDEGFGGLVGFYVPRLIGTEVPPRPDRVRGAQWKFGNFEVVGLLDAKDEAIYNEMTGEEACEAIRATTVQDEDTRKAIEDRVGTILAASATRTWSV